MKLVIILSLFLVLYCLLSISILNNRLVCYNKHINYKNMLVWETSGTYKMFNPSIVKYKNEYLMCVRYSNRILKNFLLWTNGCLFYKSYICFVILSSNMDIKRVIFPHLEHKYLEDPRVHIHDDLIFVSVVEFNSNIDIYPVLYIFNNDFSLKKRIEFNRKMYFNKYPVQKNWCLFSNKKNMFIHTDSYPIWNVYKIDYNNGNLYKHISINTSIFFKDSNESIIRCSTSWKSFDKHNYICGLHTKSYVLHKLATIRTILVLINKKTLIPIKKTEVLCVDVKYDTRIQFLSGLETDKKNIYLTYGIGDYKVEIKRIPKYYILSLFDSHS